MILLEQLYRRLPGDDQVRHLDPLFEFTEQLAAASPLGAIITITERRAVLLTHVLGELQPGAAQNITAGSLIQLQDPQVARVVRLATIPNALAANVGAVLNWQGEVVLTPGCTIAIVGVFNAAVAANNVRLSAYGMLIPLGNVERI